MLVTPTRSITAATPTQPQEEAALVSDLSVCFTVPARRVDVEFRVPLGSTTALIGPNGAGKSTCFDVISGLVRPASGRIALGERLLGEGRSWTASHRRGVAQLAQNPLLFPTMSVEHNVAFGLRAAGTRKDRALAAARSMLERVGAANLTKRRPADLSGGQAQRVAIARALVTDPGLLLFDEPFAALDRDSTDAIRGLMRELLASRSALLITHDARDARELADFAVVLDAGRVAQQGTVDQVFADPATDFVRRFAA